MKVIVCDNCNGAGTEVCDYCAGTGDAGNEVCPVCDGEKREICTTCWGSGDLELPGEYGDDGQHKSLRDDWV